MTVKIWPPPMRLEFQPGDIVLDYKHNQMTVVGTRVSSFLSGNVGFDILCRITYTGGSMEDTWYLDSTLKLYKRDGQQGPPVQ